MPTRDQGSEPLPRPDQPKDSVQELAEQGYTCDLVHHPDTTIECRDCGARVHASDVEVDEFRREEGPSDPASEEYIAAIRFRAADNKECRGVLVLGYGPTAAPEDGEMLRVLGERKRLARRYGEALRPKDIQENI